MFGLTWLETIYWVFTIVGGTLFILRTALMLAGGGLSDDALDAGFEADLPAHDLPVEAHPGLEGDHQDADSSFKFLSLQGLTAFFMMFGLVGLALVKAGLPALLTVLGAMLAGLFTQWFISLLFTQLKRLSSEGTIDIRNTVGQPGTVYLTIPPGASGQVQVVVQGALKIFDAVSHSREKLAPGQKVRVLEVVDGSTILVEQVTNTSGGGS